MLSVFSRFHSWVLAEEVVSALSLRARSSPALQVGVTGSHGRKLSGHLMDRYPQIFLDICRRLPPGPGPGPEEAPRGHALLPTVPMHSHLLPSPTVLTRPV